MEIVLDYLVRYLFHIDLFSHYPGWNLLNATALLWWSNESCDAIISLYDVHCSLMDAITSLYGDILSWYAVYVLYKNLIIHCIVYTFLYVMCI